MKKITQVIAILFLLLTGSYVYACDNSSFTLVSMNDLGAGQYEFTVEFCAGGGQDYTGYGAENGTGAWGVQLVGGASFVSYPASFTSPQTGAVYGAIPYETNYVFYDVVSYPGTGFGADWWTTTAGGWGPPDSYCITFSYVTSGMPVQMILMGAEAAGVGVAPYGCNGLPEMEINFGLSADAGISQNICAGSCATLTASASVGTPPYSFLWSNGATTATTSVCPMANATYTVTVTDALGNTATDYVPIYVNPVPVVSAGTDKTITKGYGALCTTLNGTATGTSSPYSYSWSNGSTSATPSVCPTATTTYTLTVSDYYGCTATDQVIVTYKDVRCGPSLNKVYVCKAGTTKCINSGQVSSHLTSGWVLGACWMKLGDDIAESDHPIAIFPNPASQESEVVFVLSQDGFATIEIFNMAGQKQEMDLQPIMVFGGAETTQKLNIRNLASGIYIISVTTDSGERLIEKMQVSH